MQNVSFGTLYIYLADILLQNSFFWKPDHSFSYRDPSQGTDSVQQIRQSCSLHFFWIYRSSLNHVSCPLNLPVEILCSVNHLSEFCAGQLPNQPWHSLDYCASLLLMIEHYYLLCIILELYYPMAMVIQFIKCVSYCWPLAAKENHHQDSKWSDITFASKFFIFFWGGGWVEGWYLATFP